MNKRKILVVDDEPIARDNLAHVVAKDGHLVRVAASGQEAVDHGREHPRIARIEQARHRGPTN